MTVIGVFCDQNRSKKLIIWNYLGRVASLNVLGFLPPKNQRITTEISSRSRHTHGEEMYG